MADLPQTRRVVQRSQGRRDTRSEPARSPQEDGAAAMPSSPMADLSKMKELCNVLGLNLMDMIQYEVDSSVVDVDSWFSTVLDREISNRLEKLKKKLAEMKSKRFRKMKEWGSVILPLWDTLCAAVDEKKDFINLVSYLDTDSEDDITETNGLAQDVMKKVQSELYRVQGKANTLVMEERYKLEEILKSSHLEAQSVLPDGEPDTSDPLAALTYMRLQITKARARSSERSDIVTRMELLHQVNEEAEESKAEDMMKMVQKMMCNLEKKLDIWESKKGTTFEYDGMDAREVLGNITKSKHQVAATKDGVNMQVEHLPFEGKIVQKPRTPRVQVQPQLPVQAVWKTGTLQVPVQAQLAVRAPPPDPPSPANSNKSDESMENRSSPANSNKSDESMEYRSDPNESMEYRSDPNDSDFNPGDSVDSR